MGTGVTAPRLRAVLATIAAAFVWAVVLPTASAQAAPVTFSVNSPTVAEGTAPASGTAAFTVTLSEAVGNTVTVDVHTSSVTATSSLDFNAVPNTTLTFAPGQTTRTVSVQLIGDSTDENDERFTLQLTNATGGASIPPPTFGTATILDDDDPPRFSVEDSSVQEQTNATSLIAFKIKLSAASGKPVTVKWGTMDGSAVAPGDYKNTTNTVTFNPGTVGQNVTVQIVGDNVDETDENFFLVLADPTNATIDDGTAVGLIRDDDGPNVTITGATVIEGGPGTTQTARLTVALSALSPQDVSVAAASTDGSATAGADYEAIPAGTRLTVPAGQLVRTIEVPVLGDALDEPDETFSVNLTAPQGANITAATGLVTITDDDPTPSVVAFDTVVLEGTGGATAATVTVGLTAASTRTLSATYVTRDGTAQAGIDYAGQNGSLTFDPGETVKTVSIPVASDAVIEEEETFELVVTGTANPGTSAVATIRILDDDLTPAATPNLSISDGSPVREGDSGTRAAEFIVRMDRPLARQVAVKYGTAPGTATSPEDFETTQGALTFAPGEDSKTISVPIKGDSEIESNEDFTVVLSEPINARVASATGLGIIVDDDSGLTKLDVPHKAVRSASLLCGRGVASGRCRGLLVRWASEVSGSMRVDVDAFLPAKKTTSKQKTSKKTTSRAAKGSTPKRRLRLLRRTYKVKRGERTVRVRRFSTKSTSLIRRLKAAKVKTARVTLTFTNSGGAREIKRFTIRLR